MIQAFHKMATAGGQIEVGALSEGIYTAMTTTVVGLVVGIIAYVGYNHLVVKTDKIVHKWKPMQLTFRLIKRPIIMNLRGRNKVSAEFNMSSMTDIVFLLLIFFMLTSTMVTTNALDLVLPKAKENRQQ
jgi:hypothetical protein